MTTHDLEQQYYELSELWRPERHDAAETERVSIAARWIPDDAASVLDVGCGNGLLLDQLGHIPRLAGADRSRTALRSLRAVGQRSEAGRCQADVAQLPFRDRSFDLVAALEVIEHLAGATFDLALNELARAAHRYILISVPYKEDLRESSVRCARCGSRFHPTYHMRSFAHGDLTGLFVRRGIDFACLRVAPIVEGHRFVLTRELKRIIRIERRATWPSVCPQCGFSPEKPPSAGAGYRSGHGLVSLAKAIWPRMGTYRWWLALYGRQPSGR